MDEIYKINHNDIIKTFKSGRQYHAPKYINVLEEYNQKDKKNYEQIEHLSKNEYKVYLCDHKYNAIHSERGYYIGNVKRDMWIFAKIETVKPKSAREALHNIQEAKKFYEKQLRSR